MAGYKAKDIESSLKKKGFTYEPDKKNHRFYRFYWKGKKTSIATSVSHRGKSIDDDDLISDMCHELKISKKQFDGLVRCPFKEEHLIAHLIEKGIIDY